MGTKPYSQRIPSLHNGISTQAPSSRFPSQVADAENALFNVVSGVSTRVLEMGGLVESQVSRAISALVAIEAEYFSRLYDAVEPEPLASIALVADDGRIAVASPAGFGPSAPEKAASVAARRTASGSTFSSFVIAAAAAGSGQARR